MGLAHSVMLRVRFSVRVSVRVRVRVSVRVSVSQLTLTRTLTLTLTLTPPRGRVHLAPGPNSKVNLPFLRNEFLFEFGKIPPAIRPKKKKCLFPVTRPSQKNFRRPNEILLILTR